MMSFSLSAIKTSKWRFKTSATGGLGVAFFAASGGLIELHLGEDGDILFFYYGGAGVGWSWGGKLPKIPKIPRIDLKGKSAAGSSTTLFSEGIVLVLSGCKKDDLDPQDFQGPCVFVDAGISLFEGYSGTVMLAGLDPLILAKVMALAALPGAIDFERDAMIDLVKSAKALIELDGRNVGAQIGFGISGSLGYLHLSKITDNDGNCINDAHGFCRPER